MNDYELVTILNADIKDEDVGGTVERLTQFITNRGGEVQNVDQWGRRRLAYPIARQMEGTYVVTHLRLQPANAAELEANLRISEDVIRHLLVRYNPAEQAAALAASQRRRPRPYGEDQPQSGPMASAGAGAPAPAEPEGAASAPAPAAAPGREAIEPEAAAAAATPAEAPPATPSVEPAEEVSEPEAQAAEETEEPSPNQGA